MSVDSFSGFNQNDATRIVDSDGDELAINADGSINVGVTAAIEYEIKNDTGAPLPVADGGGSLTVDDGGSTISVDDGGASISIDDNGGSITVDGSVSIEGKRPSSLGMFTVNVAGSAVALPSLPGGAELALVNIENGNVNWRDDGTNPTTSNTGGHRLLNGSQQKFDQASLSAVRFIRRGAIGSADLVVTYYEYV